MSKKKIRNPFNISHRGQICLAGRSYITRQRYKSVRYRGWSKTSMLNRLMDVGFRICLTKQK